MKLYAAIWRSDQTYEEFFELVDATDEQEAEQVIWERMINQGHAECQIKKIYEHKPIKRAR